ncbi:MAG: NYN domain-containing protein [Lachnospiraceae bacterium]|nr:NYN domain-containing protein [Lachnospiraceae bacterium]
MANIVLGILAHVDAGKTTLSEAFAYKTGVRKKLGRVDNGDSMLDTDEQERRRGITIFSKQAVLPMERFTLTLLDTPGHVDFAAEAERTLAVLDYAILLISAADGVQGHTLTLFRLLKEYNIPTFVFVNKMDQPGADAEACMKELKAKLSSACVDFSEIAYDKENVSLYGGACEDVAMLTADEDEIDAFLETGRVRLAEARSLIAERELFPCFFGSALRLSGVDELLEMLELLCAPPRYGRDFGALCYKITRDAKGERLAHVKITGGGLKLKDVVGEDGDKVNEIRMYNGDKYENLSEAKAGDVVAIPGLSDSYAGCGYGFEKGNDIRLIEPVIVYTMLTPDNIKPRHIYPEIMALSEEMPELSVEWDETNEEIRVKLMGRVQLEILTELILVRLHFTPRFTTGRITYKETVKSSAVGVGHFEPLRHYAEVHVRIEPGERGSGIEIESELSEDVLDKNWQRLIMYHLREKQHKGVLMGGQLTDVKLVLINGRAHPKHTEGGDFRKATIRAVRQGLMKAESMLLEPYYNFTVNVPSSMLGRAMTDLNNLYAHIDTHENDGENAVIIGRGPVSTLMDYQVNLNSYTGGKGQMSVTLAGYDECHNEEEVLAGVDYDPEADLANPPSSVFCAHGAGFVVPWYEVDSYKHLTDEEAYENVQIDPARMARQGGSFDGISIDLEEIDSIISRTAAANANKKKSAYKKKKLPDRERVMSSGMPSGTASGGHVSKSAAQTVSKDKLLIVDGFNIIYAWDDLSALLKDNMDSAKLSLIRILSNYQGMCDREILLVFDGYKTKGNQGSETKAEQITVVHTKEGVTADAFIERFTHDMKAKYEITVASSDGMIQTIVRGQGGYVMSANDLKEDIKRLENEFKMNYNLKES